MKIDVRQKFAFKIEKKNVRISVFTHQNEIGYLLPAGKNCRLLNLSLIDFIFVLQITSWADLKQPACENPYKFACGNFVNQYKAHEMYLNNQGEWSEKSHLEYEGTLPPASVHLFVVNNDFLIN